jgi:hypothetical protein
MSSEYLEFDSAFTDNQREQDLQTRLKQIEALDVSFDAVLEDATRTSNRARLTKAEELEILGCESDTNDLQKVLSAPDRRLDSILQDVRQLVETTREEMREDMTVGALKARLAGMGETLVKLFG